MVGTFGLFQRKVITPSISSPTTGWRTYYTPQFALALRYPPELTPVSLGPNYFQQQVDKGFQISGTVEPSPGGVEFDGPAKKFLFDIHVYDNSGSHISPGDYQDHLYTSGGCDLRWGFQPTSIVMLAFPNFPVIQVTGKDQGYHSCYYFADQTKYLFVITTVNYPDLKSLIPLQQTISTLLSSVQLYNQHPSGKPCGGIAANLPEYQCPSGYTCQLEGHYPDAGGQCVKD